MKAITFTISLLLIYSLSAISQVNTSSLEVNIDQLIKKIMVENNIPGFAIGVIKDKKVIFAKGYGVSKLNGDKAVTTESLFHMASVTKTFVATAIMQLVEQEKLKMEGFITDYLPYFKLKDQRYKLITIKHLLCHTSGLPDVEDYNWEKPEFDDYALERYVRSLEDLPMISNPGEQYYYSNIGFEILGDVIAKTSGQPFEVYIRENILKPLGMTKSGLLLKEIDQKLLTSPHTRDKYGIKTSPVFPYNRVHAPSSTLYSNIEDMMHWAMANLNHGQLNNRKILNESSYIALWSPNAVVKAEMKIGLCWFIERRGDIDIIKHEGRDVGFTSSLLLIPKDSIAVVTMKNYLPGRGYPDINIANIVLDLILKSK